MAFENPNPVLPLFSGGSAATNLADLSAQVQELLDAFASHNHDGVNSRSFDSIQAQTISVANAIIGGYRLFEATVGPTGSGSNYPTVAAALLAGKTRIFVRNGTYANEPIWNITNANTIIQGESLGGVQITFAQDVTNARSIYVNASRFTIRDVQLISYEGAVQALFVFGASGQFPVVEHCVFRNKQGKFFNGSALINLYGTFKDLYLDCSTTLSAADMIGFYMISNSTIMNCVIYMNFAASGFNPVDTCTNSYFVGCFFLMDSSRANEFTINSSSTCFFSSCYFYAYQIKCNANFDACFLENNGNSPSGFFIQLTAAADRFNNNRVKCGASDNIFTITAANVQACNNYFDGGKAMTFDPAGSQILAIQFSNNQWVSAYATSAMDLRMGSVGHVSDNANVIGNIFRNNSNSFVPTITNNSANCNVSLNQLIQG